jgi:glucokinase
MILAGDIGGTKADLALLDPPVERFTRRLACADFPGLEALIERFLHEAASAVGSPPRVSAAAFGIAGPVQQDRVVGTNLPWVVEAAALSRSLNGARVRLLNDLEATAQGLVALGPADLATLHAAPTAEGAPRAILAAGTGLGQAALAFCGGEPVALPSEGGHIDYAPRNELEVELWRWLAARHPESGGHVSWERVLSGPGLGSLYEFLRDTGREVEPSWLAEERRNGDPNGAITAADGRAPIATRAVDLFIEAYATQAANLALTYLARGGVYLAGGIAPRLEARLADGRFERAYLDKGRLRDVVAGIPVFLVRNPRTALLGAARAAQRMVA